MQFIQEAGFFDSITARGCTIDQYCHGTRIMPTDSILFYVLFSMTRFMVPNYNFAFPLVFHCPQYHK
jgi:hypothetical protein